jgi:hypothetical protein
MGFVVCNAYSTSSDEAVRAEWISNASRCFVIEDEFSFFCSFLKKKSLPKLKKFILSMYTVPDGLDDLKAPNLQNLTLYTVQCASWNILKVKALKVKAFQKLRTLGFRAASIPKTSEERIVLPHLNTLWISATSSLEDFVAFEKWHAPQLKKISLSRHIELQNFKGIDPFLKTLSTLTFHNMQIHSFEGLTNKALPQLRDLDLSCIVSDKALKHIRHLDLKNVKKLNLNVGLYPKSKYTRPLRKLSCLQFHIVNSRD